jgi:flavin-dependent dehydrogenase
MFRAIPLMANRLERGTPISPTLLLARIENTRSRLTDDDGVIVSGYVLLGDSAMHTNPTLGRGVSLAVAHAQHLAQSIGEAADDPLGFVRAFDVWTQDNLGAWYDSQEINDAARSADMECAVNPNASVSTAPSPLAFSRAFAADGGV